MKKEPINLNAKTKGERWFQSCISNASGLGWAKFLLFSGVILTLIYFIFFFDPVGGVVFLLLGIGWICAGVVHFERYQARKAILRLMNTNEAGEPIKPSEQE